MVLLKKTKDDIANECRKEKKFHVLPSRFAGREKQTDRVILMTPLIEKMAKSSENGNKSST